MIQRILLIGLIALMKFSISLAQDIHWSQFNDIPMFQNPGHAGHFDGDYRFVGNYRNQWRSVTVPFSTLSLSTDMHLPNYRNLGVGLLFFHDAVGDGKLQTTELQANVSYLLKLTSDSSHILRGGMNFGMNHRQINWNQLYFDNQFNGIQFDPNLPTNELFQTDRKTNLSVGAGVIYEYLINKREKITAGFGAFNLNRPNQGFYTSVIPRDIRYNLYREFVAGSSLKYTLINKRGDYKAIYAGIWYRTADAAYVSVGMDYQSWFVGLSYDINFSKLVPASNMRGGFEIATRYILSRFKPKKMQHRVCPDFI
jgi:type IX secretion system PorP/SprF family membrane protein